MNDLKKKLLEAEKESFSGWDFSILEGRMIEEELPWDYKKILQGYLENEHKLLDMGTGGGEFLLTINHPYNQTTITESYPPNIKLCKERLTPLGIKVVAVEDDHHLPIEDEKFDVIINRHEYYAVDEIKRLLKTGGIFITQQVGDQNSYKIARKILGDFQKQVKAFNLNSEVKKIKEKGFKLIDAKEYFPWMRFYDLEAFVYFAKVIQWEFPGFSVKKHYNQLKSLQKEIHAKGYIQGDEHRFLIVARKAK